MIQSKIILHRVKELAERTRSLIPPPALGSTNGLVLTSARNEYHVAITSDSTGLRIIDRTTNEPILSTGWPYHPKSENSSDLEDAILDLETMVNLLNWSPSSGDPN